jgi:hypothetical protein
VTGGVVPLGLAVPPAWAAVRLIGDGDRGTRPGGPRVGDSGDDIGECLIIGTYAEVPDGVFGSALEPSALADNGGLPASHHWTKTRPLKFTMVNTRKL